MHYGGTGCYRQTDRQHSEVTWLQRHTVRLQGYSITQWGYRVTALYSEVTGLQHHKVRLQGYTITQRGYRVTASHSEVTGLQHHTVRLQGYSITQYCDIVTDWLMMWGEKKVTEERAEMLNWRERRNWANNLKCLVGTVQAMLLVVLPLLTARKLRNYENNKTGNVYNIAVCLYSHCCSGKQWLLTQSMCECLALGIQHAMRMRRIILSSVACTALQ